MEKTVYAIITHWYDVNYNYAGRRVIECVVDDSLVDEYKASLYSKNKDKENFCYISVEKTLYTSSVS